jgi:hypothetical protein
LAFSTIALIIWGKYWCESAIQRRVVSGWSIGLAVGILIQALSPATWGRGGGLGSEAALTTNVQAVERLFTVVENRLGSELVDSLLSAVSIDMWARILVPFAVLGDLVVRPGLIAVIGVVAWWMTRNPDLYVARVELRRRLAVGLVVVSVAAVGYAGSGALYAYAGRHAAGLALVVTALAAGWAVYLKQYWLHRRRAVAVFGAASTVLLALLALTQIWVGFNRASAWDESLENNKVLISEGRLTELESVGYRAGLSSSGLRDHDGSGAYIDWLRRVFDLP